MPLNCPYQTRFIQQYGTTVDCLITSIPVQTQTGGSDWLIGDDIQSVSAKTQFSAAIKIDGTLWLWGAAGAGKLGNNATTDRCSPVQTVSQGTNWKQVSLGDSYAAAIKCDGTLWLWGNNSCGYLGNLTTTNTSSPIQTISQGTNWKQVGLGYTHSAAVKTDGTLWLWGDGSIYGTLGNGNDTFAYSSPVQTISQGNNWKQVSLGAVHSGAIKTDGTLWMWGAVVDGRLGNGETGTGASPKCSPVQTIAQGNNWKQVSLGFDHSTAIKTDGTLWLWGYGNCGKLGMGTTNAAQCSPVQTISTGTNWKQVSGTCNTGAVKTDGTLWVWGCGAGGSLGDDTTTAKSSPVQTVSQGNNWKQIGVGLAHTIANKTDGTLWGWGQAGVNGELGEGLSVNRCSPVQTIATVTTWRVQEDSVRSMLIGSAFTGAIKTDGTLWMWGCNVCGTLGNNDTIAQSSPVQTISQTTNWCQISGGQQHVVALKNDGTLWTWGYGIFGVLGNANTTDRSSPVQTIAQGTNWKQVSAGNTTNSAAVKYDGTLWMWGRGNFGQLGNNDTIDVSSPIQAITQGTNWKQVNTSGVTAAIKTDGTLWLWGCGLFGQLGNNSTLDVSSPVQTVSTGTNWKQVSSTDGFAGAIKTDGTLWLWGSNTYGNLGNNSTIDRSIPVQTIANVNNWEKISIAPTFTSATKFDGTLWMWGRNVPGTLGNNSTIDQCSPVQTVCTGLSWKELASYGYYTHAGAITNDGVLYNWGCNNRGQLGCDLLVNSKLNTDLGNILVDKEYLLEVYPNINPQMKAPALWGWGSNSTGRLGNNSTINQSSPVQTISAGTNWDTLADSVGSTFGAIKTDGTLWLWGDNTNGKLGNNNTLDISSPVQTVSTGTNWKQAALTGTGAAAVKTDGTLWVWGQGSGGRLGNNNTIDVSSPVQTISNVATWKQVSRSTCITAAIKIDGTLWTWGLGGNGRLGNNNTIDVSSPVQTVATGTNWKQVSTHFYHTAAIKRDGTLWLWGDNTGTGISGWLGTNNNNDASSPVQTIATGSNWKQVSLAQEATYAIKTDGTLWVWGNPQGGQLAITNVGGNMYSSPTQTISPATNWKQVSGGGCFAGAIKTDGTLWTWGRGQEGQLGNNSTINQSSPVQTISTGNDWKQVSGAALSLFAIRESYDW